MEILSCTPVSKITGLLYYDESSNFLQAYTMELSITTPALLFPAISLLLVAYTSRFVVLTGVIRDFNTGDDPIYHDVIRRQVKNLRMRLKLIQVMQFLGVLSFVVCTLSMFAIFIDALFFGKCLFGLSLVLLVASLIFSLFEVKVSTKAIDIEIEKLGSDKGV